MIAGTWMRLAEKCVLFQPGKIRAHLKHFRSSAHDGVRKYITAGAARAICSSVFAWLSPKGLMHNRLCMRRSLRINCVILFHSGRNGYEAGGRHSLVEVKNFSFVSGEDFYLTPPGLPIIATSPHWHVGLFMLNPSRGFRMSLTIRLSGLLKILHSPGF